MSRVRFQQAKDRIEKYLNALDNVVFKKIDLAVILNSNQSEWNLPKSTTISSFVDFLATHSQLKRYNFPFPYRSETRYAWGKISLLEVLLSIKPNAYFSHYTAMWLHRLTNARPKTIYLNHEQRAHIRNSELTQNGIDAAFKRSPRESNNVIEIDDLKICLINGMHTGNLNVITERLSYDELDPILVRVTNIERTLIDIAVRPTYAGGPTEVLRAYLLAKDRLDPAAFAPMLRKLNYVYPYHQVVGYYLERSGFSPEITRPLQEMPMENDFYLTHQMSDIQYIKNWRLYVPRHLEDLLFVCALN